MSEALPGCTETSIPALRLDPYATSSLLQKAIRRGEADLAERAAIRLYRLRGKGVWRRLLVIAFEDVGVGSVEGLVKTATMALDALNGMLRLDAEEAIAFLARLLAEAPKDRSSDHLVGAAFSHPTFEDARRIIAASCHAERLDLVAEEEAALPVRAIAVWRSSGIKWGVTPGEQGSLADLMATFRRFGVPGDLIRATSEAAIRTREPIVIMAPLLWLAALNNQPAPNVVRCQVPEASAIEGVPLYTFDKHTAIGKVAIQRLARESQPVRDVLRAFAPAERAREVAAMAAFYADAAPVSKRLDWNGAAALEGLGTKADMMRAGALAEGIEPILAVVRDNLGHLNWLRVRGYCRK
jgi:hypothetical protein